MRWKVGKASDLPPGRLTTVTVNGKEIVVLNAGKKFYAMDNACPHRGGPLSEGRREGTRLTCPWHEWSFDMKDGTLAVNPDVKIATHTVVQDGNDLFLEI